MPLVSSGSHDLCVLVSYRYHGDESVQSALTYHLLARAHSYLGDFRAALNHEKITFSIYQKKVCMSLHVGRLVGHIVLGVVAAGGGA